MPLINISFFILLVVSGAFAWRNGGWEGRSLCTMLLLAAAATPFGLTLLQATYGVPNVIFAVDCTLLVGLGVVASQTDRYWPLWIFAFHLISVLTFAAWSAAPTIMPRIFEDAAAFWSIPIQLILFAGPYLDRRSERIRFTGP